MFGIGFPELLVILALALIVLGPEQLPRVARKLARFVNELRRTADEFKSEFDVDEITDLKLLDRMDLKELDQTRFQPGGLGGEWKEAKGRGREHVKAGQEKLREGGSGKDPDEESKGEQPDSAANRVS